MSSEDNVRVSSVRAGTKLNRKQRLKKFKKILLSGFKNPGTTQEDLQEAIISRFSDTFGPQKVQTQLKLDEGVAFVLATTPDAARDIAMGMIENVKKEGKFVVNGDQITIKIPTDQHGNVWKSGGIHQSSQTNTTEKSAAELKPGLLFGKVAQFSSPIRL